MNSLIRRLRLGDEAGLSLLEVVIAMLIFAMVSIGIIQALVSTLAVTRDSRARVVAANLASQEIDLARDVEDLFDLQDKTTVYPDLNGEDFTVVRTARWVSNPDADLACGAGGGTLRYKRVNVEVSWNNMRTGTEKVRADTVIDPAQRINDPSLGSILVSVHGESGSGVGGVTVSAVPDSPANGAQAVASVTTDAQGCAYLLKVVPGNYVVSISKSGFVSDKHLATPTQQSQVVAGTASSHSFAYDNAATFTVNYVTPSGPGAVRLPTDLTMSFESSYGVTQLQTNASSLKLFPHASGYSFIAGSYGPRTETVGADCLNPDPGEWQAGVRSGKNVAGTTPAPVAAAPGGTATVTVPMGRVNLSNVNSQYIKAVSVAPAQGNTGDPGCAVGTTLSFGQMTTANPTIALPYGSWKIYRGSSSLLANITTLLTSLALGTGTTGVVSSNTVTLDPRVEQ